METYDPEASGSYYVLGNSNTEMMHLIVTDRLFNAAMGGLLPEQPETLLSEIQDVLDVACGPGGWALEMAQANPHMQVTGIDVVEGMIEYANVQADASGLDNAHFQVGDILQPLDFPDASFDLVNARHLEFAVPVTAWPVFIGEMVRVTRPGGIIRITDSEWGVSNSFAFEKLQQLAVQAGLPTGMSHSGDGRNFGITAWLGSLLRNAGCVDIQERPSLMDFSSGAKFHEGGSRIVILAYQMIAPFLLGMQVITPPELAQLQSQQEVELLDPASRALIYTLTAWGRKP
jgi:SAM-dependent methyltransferase